MEGQKAQVVLVDDHRSFAEALGLAISMTSDLEVVGTASDADSAYELVLAARPSLLVTDYRLPGATTGLDLTERLQGVTYGTKQPFRQLPVIVLTGYPTPQVLSQAADLGASVMSKNSRITAIVSALRAVLAGDGIDSHAVDDPFGLSAAELEVLGHLSQGLSATEIAAELYLSVHAIRGRIKSMLRKMEVSSQLEAVAKANRFNLVVPPQGVPGAEEARNDGRD